MDTNHLLKEVNSAYAAGLTYYDEQDLNQAELEFAKVLRPVLSKPTTRKISLKSEDHDITKVVLDSMYHLALIYLQSSHHHNNYAKAAAMLQYCNGFAKKYELEDDKYLREAHGVESKFLQNAQVSELDTNHDLYHIANIKWYRDKILTTQKKVKSVLEEIDAHTIRDIGTRVTKIEELYESCSSLFVNKDGTGILQSLLDECYAQLGQPPSEYEYSIVGLGSLSSGTITPWSDVEFAILISDDREELKEYFRKLTKLLHIKVVNLGTTHLRGMGIEALNNFRTAQDEDDWFWDDIMSSGISFDGAHWHACKSPLGRTGYYAATKIKTDSGNGEIKIEKKRDYELILTPEKMALFFETGDEVFSWFSSDKHLVQSLKRVSLIDGSITLLDQYRKTIKLKEQANIDIFKAGEVEILSEDISKFGLKILADEDGKLIDVKKDLYRLGDRILISLANYYGIFPDEGEHILTIWQITERIEQKNILTYQISDLREAMSVAVELRLRTYSQNGGQMETLSTYQPAIGHLDSEQKHRLVKETFYIQDLEIIFHFYDVMFSIQAFMTDFCNHRDHPLFLHIPMDLYKLFNVNNFSKGMVRAKFLQYNEALTYLKLAEEQLPNNLQLLHNLMLISHKMSKMDDAIAYSEKVTRLTSEALSRNSHSSLSNIDLAKAYLHQGSMYLAKKFYDLALTSLQKGVDTLGNELSNPQDFECMFSIQCNIGSVYFFQHRYDEAIIFYKQVIEAMNRAHVNEPHHRNFAKVFSNLASVYNEIKDYHNAIEYHKKALEINNRLHINNPNHPDIALTYISIGLSYHDQGEYDIAIDHYHKALDIMQRAQEAGNLCHEYIGGIYLSLANAHYKKEEYDTAIIFFKKALDTDIHQSDIAGIYNNLGKTYAKIGQYALAIECHDKAFEVMGYFEKNLMIAINYQKMADIFKNQEDQQEQAIKCYQKSLQIMKMVYIDNPFSEILAVIHLNLAFVYKKQEKYEKEIECYCQALLIKREIYSKNAYHPELVALYNFLAAAYENNKQHEQAIKYYHIALKSSEIRNLQGDALYPHDFLIILHIKLAKLYAHQDEREKTKYHFEMTQLLRKIYESAAPDIPLISEAYSRIGKINLALEQSEQAIKDLYRSLNLQLVVYAESISEHPEIAQNYLFLTMAYSMKQELKPMLRCMIKAYKIIIHHPDHPEFSQINDMFTQHIIPLFAEHYSLDIESIKRKIFEYIDQDQDFMNPYLHYSKAESLYAPSCNSKLQDAIQNYVLALALLPTDAVEMRSKITLKLSSLGGSTSLDQIGDSINSLEEPEFYYAIAESYNITEESIQNSREAIIEYLLTLVFLTEDEDFIGEDIKFKLLDLGMSDEQLESWLPILQTHSIDRNIQEVELSGNVATEYYS